MPIKTVSREIFFSPQVPERRTGHEFQKKQPQRKEPPEADQKSPWKQIDKSLRKYKPDLQIST